MKLLLELKTSKEPGPVNLLPLCRLRQALQDASAPRKKIRADSKTGWSLGQ